MKPLTWETAKKEGAIESLRHIEKWIIIGETLPSIEMYSAFLKDKIEELKQKYQ